MYQETRLKTIIFLYMATAMGDVFFWIRRALMNKADKRKYLKVAYLVRRPEGGQPLLAQIYQILIYTRLYYRIFSLTGIQSITDSYIQSVFE